MSNFLQDSYKISIEASPHQFWMSLAWPRFLSNFPVILPSNYLGHEKNRLFVSPHLYKEFMKIQQIVTYCLKNATCYVYF